MYGRNYNPHHLVKKKKNQLKYVMKVWATYLSIIYISSCVDLKLWEKTLIFCFVLTQRWPQHQPQAQALVQLNLQLQESQTTTLFKVKVQNSPNWHCHLLTWAWPSCDYEFSGGGRQRRCRRNLWQGKPTRRSLGGRESHARIRSVHIGPRHAQNHLYPDSMYVCFFISLCFVVWFPRKIV